MAAGVRPDPKDEYCICTEHSGVRANIDNINIALQIHATKLEKIFGRINIVLGSVCVSLLLIIVDILIRISQLN